MKYFPAPLGLVSFGLLAFCWIGTAYSGGVRPELRKVSSRSARAFTSNINQAAQVNDTQPGELVADKPPSSAADRLTKGHLPLCTVGNSEKCAKTASGGSVEVTRRKTTLNGRKSKTKKIHKSKKKSKTDSLIDRFFSFWRSSKEETDSDEGEKKNVPNKTTLTPLSLISTIDSTDKARKHKTAKSRRKPEKDRSTKETLQRSTESSHHVTKPSEDHHDSTSSLSSAEESAAKPIKHRTKSAARKRHDDKSKRQKSGKRNHHGNHRKEKNRKSKSGSSKHKNDKSSNNPEDDKKKDKVEVAKLASSKRKKASRPESRRKSSKQKLTDIIGQQNDMTLSSKTKKVHENQPEDNREKKKGTRKHGPKRRNRKKSRNPNYGHSTPERRTALLAGGRGEKNRKAVKSRVRSRGERNHGGDDRRVVENSSRRQRGRNKSQYDYEDGDYYEDYDYNEDYDYDYDYDIHSVAPVGRRRYPPPPAGYPPRRGVARGRGRNQTWRGPRVYDRYYDGYYDGYFDRYIPRRRRPIGRYVPRRPYVPNRRRRPFSGHRRGENGKEESDSEEKGNRRSRPRKERKRPKPDVSGEDIPEESVSEPFESSPKPITPFAFTTNPKRPDTDVSGNAKDKKDRRKDSKKRKGNRFKKDHRKKTSTIAPTSAKPVTIAISKTLDKKIPVKVEISKSIDATPKIKLETGSRRVHTKTKESTPKPTEEKVSPSENRKEKTKKKAKQVQEKPKKPTEKKDKNTYFLTTTMPTKLESEHRKKESRPKSGGGGSAEKTPQRQDSRRRWPSRNRAEEWRRQRERDRNRAYQARLLRSNVARLSDRIMVSLETVLKALRSKVNVAYNRYDGLFNTTRYDIMMGVRDGLHVVVNTNDDVYGIILDMSRLVRHVYQRAHEQHLINPSTRRRKVEQPVQRRDFRSARRKAEQEHNSAMYMLNKAKRQKRRCSELKSHKMGLKTRLMKMQAEYKLRELTYYSNRTIRRVENVIQYNTAQRKITYLSDTQTMAKTLMMEAKDYNQMAFDYITECTLEGWRCTDALRDAKIRWKRTKELYQQTPRESQPTLSPADRSMLRWVLDRANQHVREQEYLRQVIEREVYPLLRQLKAVIEYRKRGQNGDHTGGHTGGGTSGTRPRDRTTQQLERYLKDVTQKIEAALEKLRLRVGVVPPSETRDCRSEVGSGDDLEDCETDEVEESGSGSLGGTDIDGGLLSSGDGAENGEDDFVFVDTRTDSVRERKTSFGNRLKAVTGKLRDRSEKLYREASSIASRLAVLRVSSGRLGGAVGRVGSAYQDGVTMLTAWGEDRTEYEAIHDRVTIIVKNIRAFNKTIKAKVRKVYNTVERVLGKVTGSGGQGGFAQVVQSVGKATSNMKKIQELKLVQPDPCARTTQLRNTIGTNLTQLRENIQRFKTITSAINLPVSLSGGNYLEVPLKHETTKSHVSSFEFCVKRASSEGVLAMLKGDNAHSLTISLKEGLLSMSVAGPDDKEIDSVTNPADLKTDQWYKVFVNRYGQRYKLSVVSLKADKANGSQSAIVLDQANPVQVLPSSVFIGGQPGKKQGKNFFTGCVSDVHFGGREVNIYRPDVTGLHPPLCSTGCVSESSLVFDGSGYVSFPSSIYPRRGISSMNVLFRTLQRNTLLFLLGYLQKDVFLIASIEKGIVVVSMTTTGRTTSQRTIETSYSDGKFYNLMISLAGNRLIAAIDGKPETFTPENSADFLTKYRLNNLLVGGVSTEAQTYLKRNMSSLSGCVKKLEINQQELFISDSDVARGVSTGSCSQSMVSNCVSFTPKSKVITLPEYEMGRSVSFMFKADKVKGYLFHYKRGLRINLYMRFTPKGVELTEKVEDVVKLIPVKPDDGWHHVVLRTDEGEEKVYLRVDDNDEQSFDYSGGFWGRKKADGPITIAIRGTPEDETGDAYLYEGSIAHLLVDNSPVDLGQYALPNNLDGCRLQPSSAKAMLTGASVGNVC
ncbi:uncharacterized protein LOC135466410 isoform X2 [Liolophura sinensis]|uniref:uncharacterized protein LOC135466410 isoform X2 n=1 Tax=Liolophura sinensis TaxID=3198878 RepID=UPI0031585E83